MSIDRYVKICVFNRRYPDSFDEPAQFAGGEHVILIRSALLVHNTLTKKALEADNWTILPQNIQASGFLGEFIDAAPFYEKGLLKDTARYPLKEYANYKTLVAMLKDKFLAAQTDSDTCRNEAIARSGDADLSAKYTSYADSFQKAALLIDDALQSVEVHGR